MHCGGVCVVVFPPLFDQNSSLAQAVEELAVAQFIPPHIEAFAISVFPGGSWLDAGGLRTTGGNPVPDSLSNEFRPLSDRMRAGASRKMN